MTAQTAIRRMTNRIAKRFKPDKIVLFGSHARGTAGPDSDVDLLVIMPLNGSRREMATSIDMSLVGVNLPADVIVMSPDDVKRNRRQVGKVVHSAMREGKVVYAS